MIKIGNSILNVPDGHSLEHIYQRFPMYDFAAWNFIKEIIALNEWRFAHKSQSFSLIDVGANIGDSVLHFRRYCEFPVVAIEPSVSFFSFLLKNTANIDNVLCINKLLVPEPLVNRISFRSGSQTGQTLLNNGEGEVYDGPSISLNQLFKLSGKNIFFKTDTDGFDAEIIDDLIGAIKIDECYSPIIFFEGANAGQILARDFLKYVDVTNRLQCLGYHILILSNTGIPYVYAGTDTNISKSAFEALYVGYRYGAALCHYFDVIAVSSDFDVEPLRLLPEYIEKIYGELYST